MANVRLCDPTDPGTRNRRHKRNPKKKGPLGGIITSAIAIIIMLFAMGFFPGVNNLFSILDDTLRSHNDAIVAGVLHSIPVLLFSLGGLGLAAYTLSSITRRSGIQPKPKATQQLAA